MIPILIGWGKDTKSLAYLGIARCSNCRNYDHLYLCETSSKVTLFFVPILKWGKKYFKVCNVCDARQEISEAKKTALLAESRGARANAKIPSCKQAASIWQTLDSTVAGYGVNGPGLESQLGKVVARLEERYSEKHVKYVVSVYMDCLQRAKAGRGRELRRPRYYVP